MNDLEKAAVALAKQGWPVFPLRPRDKVPATKHGFKDASTVPALVRAWWTMTPEANVGLCTGGDFFVVDIDPRNGGDRVWAALVNAHGHVETLSATTGSGGKHYFYRLPAGVLLKGKLAEGIDIKSVGGYVVAPPSVHPDGGVYTWDSEQYAEDPGAEIADAPAWLIEQARRPEPERVVRGPVDPNDDRPGTRYNAEAEWADLLEEHGWVLVKTEGEVMYWRRPGKTEGLSATTNYGGSDLLYVFSSSTDFENGTAYSKFAVLAILEYGGDMFEAAAALAAQYEDKARANGADLFKEISSEEPGQPEAVADYTFTPAFGPEHFVTQYIEYAAQQTDAALEYSEACALALLTLAGSPSRIMLGPYGEHGLPVNLYLLLTGDSTRSRKSTSQRIMKDIAEWALPTSGMPARVTTEALIELLAKQSPQAALWTPDEFGILLSQIGRRDFLRGIEEVLLTVYGGEDYTYVKAGEKTVSVHDPALTVVAASTPEALGMAGPQAQVTGLLPRFAVVFPRVLPEARQAESAVRLKETRNRLVTQLRQVRDWSMEHRAIRFTREALDVLSKSEKALQARGDHVVRLPAMLHKVAALTAIGDTRDSVTGEDAEAAVRVVARWADSAGHLRPYMRLTANDLAFEKGLESAREIFERLAGKVGAVPRFKVAREVKTTKARMDAIEQTLTDRNYITVDRKTSVWLRPS